MELEYRAFSLMPALVTAALPAQAEIIGVVSGCAVPFESWSHNLEQRKLTEKIIKGAFGQTITLIKQGRKVVDARLNHNPKAKITDTRSGLRLREADEGLMYEMDLHDTPLGHAIKRMLTKKQITGVSIGYKKFGKSSNITEREPDKPTATPAPVQNPDKPIDGSDVVQNLAGDDKWQVLKNVDLQEISLLQGQLPAYRQTSAELRSMQAIQLHQLAAVYDGLV